eukprot:2892766-Alexandrium_andersonii.AAC.1
MDRVSNPPNTGILLLATGQSGAPIYQVPCPVLCLGRVGLGPAWVVASLGLGALGRRHSDNSA